MVVCKRNYHETCDCVYCWAETERRRRESEGITSVNGQEKT